jgi:hypothetical protein
MNVLSRAFIPATDRIPMPDSPPNDDHWRRLAADLGLEVGPESELPAPAPEPVAERSERPRVEPEPTDSGRGRRRRTPEPEPPIGAFGGGLEALEDEEPAARGRRASPEPSRSAAFEAEPEWPTSHEVADSDDANIEESDLESAAVPELNPDAAEEAGNEVAGEKTGKRRRRRRSRRKKDGPAPVGEAEAGEDTPADERSAPIATDDDDEPAEVVSNWDVPSWDELIASLHRPER